MREYVHVGSVSLCFTLILSLSICSEQSPSKRSSTLSKINAANIANDWRLWIEDWSILGIENVPVEFYDGKVENGNSQCMEDCVTKSEDFNQAIRDAVNARAAEIPARAVPPGDLANAQLVEDVFGGSNIISKCEEECSTGCDTLFTDGQRKFVPDTHIEAVGHYCAKMFADRFAGVSHCSVVVKLEELKVGLAPHREYWQIHIISDFKPTPKRMVIKCRKVLSNYADPPVIPFVASSDPRAGCHYGVFSDAAKTTIKSLDIGLRPYELQGPMIVRPGKTLRDLERVIREYLTVKGKYYKLFEADCQTFTTDIMKALVNCDEKANEAACKRANEPNLDLLEITANDRHFLAPGHGITYNGWSRNDGARAAGKTDQGEFESKIELLEMDIRPLNE